VQLSAVVSAVVGFISAALLFELQEWRRRRRHSATLKTALHGELARSERVLASFVYLWPLAEPTPTDIAEFRRLCAESGLWGEDDPKAAAVARQSDAELADALRQVGGAGMSRAPTLPTPVLDGVLAAPPQGWGADILRRLSWLGWQMHQVNDALENVDYWLRATITAPDHHLSVARENAQRCTETFRKQVTAALTTVRGLLTRLGS
jgi:hypothetical protein